MRRLRSLVHGAIFAFHRSFWDARDAVGGHTLFAAQVAVTVFVLTVVFVGGRDDLLVAFYGIAAVWVTFLIVVVFKFVQALAHPDRHRDWDWVDYGVLVTGY